MKSHFAFGFIGLMVGVSFSQDAWGALSGFCLGLLFSNWNVTRARLASLTDSLAALEAQLAALMGRPEDRSVPTEASERTQSAEVHSSAAFESPPPPTAVQEGSLEEAVSSAFATRSDESEIESIPAAPPPPPPAPVSESTGPSPFEKLIALARSFFFGGNTIVRVGLLVLLVGLTLLAKYAAENSLFPVEARLAFAAVVGLGLVVFGFRQRSVRPGFGMSLQGGGIAELYLVTFFAFKFYALLPASLAFGLFVGLAIATAILSILQKSQPLLVIGSLGGFLAPVLASTGAGSHVALFSYYLLLNLSILFVAWRQTWRIPALVAFVCTYGVASTWGVLRYEAELFASTEPFVLLFMMLFTSVAVLHAWQRPPKLRGLVDGTLVFGTPFVSIMLQGALVQDRELGMALSAAGFGLFYAGWAIFIWRRAASEMRPLAEAFVALAVGFATMAIPFAFDEALTTSIAWALEGAGLYWIGTRQSRTFPRFAGVLLQVLAGLAFFESVVIDPYDSSAFLPIANGRALSCVAIAFAGVFVARQASVFFADDDHSMETRIAQGLGIWGLIWWTSGAIAEIDQFVPEAYQPMALTLWLSATALGLELLSAHFDWKSGRLMALASLPAAVVIWLLSYDFTPNLLSHGGWIAWPLVFATFYFLWERSASRDEPVATAFRAGSLWLFAFLTATALVGMARFSMDLGGDWSVAAFGLGIAVVLIVSCLEHTKGASPFDREPNSALIYGLGPIAALAALTILLLQLEGRGTASPLPHLPVLNPIDLVGWLLALSIWSWWKRVQETMASSVSDSQRQGLVMVALALAFASLNGLLVRAVHQWTDTDFSVEALWSSSALQVTVSIAWTLVGMLGMLGASRKGWRGPWMGFAALLGVVVIKLFVVDLSQLGTLARIGTFLAVGALLLVLGYVSPVPPSEVEKGGEAPENAVPVGDPS